MKFDERMSRRELTRSVGIGTRLNGLSQDISFSEIISIRWLRQITIYQRYVFVLRSSKGFQCTSAFRLLSSFNLTCVKIWEMSKYCLHFATSDCWMLWAKNCHSWGVWKKKQNSHLATRYIFLVWMNGNPLQTGILHNIKITIKWQ